MALHLDADELQEIVAFCDEDGIIMDWNKAGEEITGYRREDVVGYHIDSILVAGAHPTMEELLAVHKTGSVLPGVSVHLQTRFGWDVPADVTSIRRPIPGVADGWLLIFRDTTLKTQLQEQLDRLDVLYRGLVENSPDIVYVLDSQARVLFINDTVEKLLGYTKKELIGRELIEIVHPDDRQHAYWPLRERRQSDRATRNLHLRLLTKSGAHRRYDLGFVYVSLSTIGLVPFRADRPLDGEHLGTQGVARDVTELIMLREFSDQVSLILPICSVCKRIRVTEGGQVDWIALTDYLGRKTGVLFSHTFCPDHMPHAH